MQCILIGLTYTISMCFFDFNNYEKQIVLISMKKMLRNFNITNLASKKNC